MECLHQGQLRALRAPVVVAADGAASPLARQAGLLESVPETLGFALRGYYTGLEDLTELLEIYMPLLDLSQRYLLPAYGWVFPTGADSANVGVGLFHRERGANVRELFGRFLGALEAEDPRFRRARPCGPWKGAPLRCDFGPERCAAPGLLLVGDAAGMISPFTGEGISYALESGKLAAETISQQLSAPHTGVLDLSEYPRQMGSRYTGYFEAGRRSVRRYLMMWHVLEGTFRNERPLFALCRQAVLFPEGLGESYLEALTDDVASLIVRHGRQVKTDLIAVGELLLATVRHDWPFLTRLALADQSDPGIPFRPALLLLLAGYFGQSRRPHLIPVAAAVELGYLAALAHPSVEEVPSGSAAPGKDQTVNWGNMFALMCGDFLLSKAYELSAGTGAAASRLMAEALARACEGRLQEVKSAYNPDLPETEHFEILSRKIGTLFELPCRLGAYLSGAPTEHTTALADYGRHIGLAFQLADDAREFMGLRSGLGEATGSPLREGSYSLPVLRALRQTGPAATGLRRLLAQGRLRNEDLQAVRERVMESGAVAEALATARQYATRAQAALDPLPDTAARRSLFRLALYAATREVPASP